MEQMGAFLPLILIFVVFYFLLIRPQQKKVKIHREMLNNLRRGDKVITSGGLIGMITKVHDNKELQIEITNDVEVRLAPGMIAELYESNVTEKKTTKTPLSKDSSNQKKGFLSGIFNNKKN